MKSKKQRNLQLIWDFHGLEQKKQIDGTLTHRTLAFRLRGDYHPPSYGRNIVCEKDRDSSVFLDYTGKFWPCCHMAEAYLSKIGIQLHSDIREYNNKELFKEYKSRFVTDTPFYICRRACGQNGKKSQWKTEEQLS